MHVIDSAILEGCFPMAVKKLWRKAFSGERKRKILPLAPLREMAKKECEAFLCSLPWRGKKLPAV
jgi:hypothetical protein